jgi:hypothetical protein
MITLDDYWMGRDAKYPADLTDAIRSNAQMTVDTWNQLLQIAVTEGVTFHDNLTTGSWVSSGWRPPEINDHTSNAATTSKHLTGQACDIYDPYGELANWIRKNLAYAEQIGLWFEDFRCTAGWVHGQIIPPGSGRRVYIPSLVWAQKLGLA